MKAKKIPLIASIPRNLPRLFCLSQLDLSLYSLIIEPGAGRGSFSNQIKNCLAFDIDPQAAEIQQQDFLEYTHEKGNILVVGNPPYGQQSKLAIQFFNKAAEFAQTIAFILPKSFRKDSVQNRLSLDFILVKDVEIPNTIFTLPTEQQIEVPCVFQIWQRTDKPRAKKKQKLQPPSLLLLYLKTRTSVFNVWEAMRAKHLLICLSQQTAIIL